VGIEHVPRVDFKELKSAVEGCMMEKSTKGRKLL
jgi:hypothetical protein